MNQPITSTKLYLISGLGADSRLYSRLQLPGLDVQFIEWLVPSDDETMNHYARRMAECITADPGEFYLGGTSFGGMVATEIAKFHSPAKLMLIPGPGTHTCNPRYFRAFPAFASRTDKTLPTSKN
ncbi:MAG: hypothetical protein KDD36_11445 [Flavobacteriales bacterium]|nr:hypothetical protein [Flavobacteriales bacterium]